MIIRSLPFLYLLVPYNSLEEFLLKEILNDFLAFYLDIQQNIGIYTNI